MGGFGGGRPRSSRGMSSMFEEDDDMSGFSNMSGGMPGGMPRQQSPSGRARTNTQPSQPSEITKPLPISLEDLFAGTTKRMKVSRKLLSGGTEDKVSRLASGVS